MNKKIIALAVAAAAFGTQASAVELYNQDGSTFSIGGHVSVSAKGNSDVGGTDIISNSPRINFTATQDLGNGFTADARGEYAINYLDGGADSFKTRLGYIGVTHDTFGRAVAGTQWSPYYDVAGIADMPIAFANDFLYDNHGALGTGRAEGMVSYRNDIQLGDNLSIFGGLGWQDNQTGFDSRGQVALGANFADFMVGYSYNAGDRTAGVASKQEAVSHALSAKYGSYGNGLYVAAVYTMNEYMHGTSNYNGVTNPGADIALKDTDAMEFIAAYAFANSLNLSINYEAVESNGNDITKGTVYSQMAFQAEYNITPSFVTFAGYQLDLGSDLTNAENDMWNVGVRYYL
ncbi:porin [Vibrio breoganii]|uniref:porin n=1 Tax=Vibrio breoganii TaxID=553239 RepID=UPI000C81C6D6|nr:porin [Vibrio breoganii]PMG92310.1 hypothetical protein BCU81_04485 [Vibrio breoganii]